MAGFPRVDMLRRARELYLRAKYHALPDARLSPIQRWIRDGGNRRRTLGLALRPTDVALDFGGFRGDYAEELLRRYGCTVHVFEPVPEFAKGIKKRFRDDDRAVVVHEYAVGRSDRTLKMHVAGDASGAFAPGPEVEVRVVAARSLVEQLPLRIPVAKVNIEGGEFELIPALHEAGLLDRIDRLFIQFHQVGDTSGEDRRACQRLLEKTHRCEWDYPFVWESWSRRCGDVGDSVVQEKAASARAEVPSDERLAS
jgi:FkbM family methyltransferase